MNGPNEVAFLAERFGLKQQGAQVQCPRTSCNGDGKCSVAVFSDGVHWRCVRCSAHGNSLEYAAYATLGEVPLENSPRWKAVLARIDGRPSSKAGKPVPATGRPTEPGVLPNPGLLSRGKSTKPAPGTVLYFEAPRTPFIPISRPRRDGKGRKS